MIGVWWLCIHILKRKKVYPWHNLDFYGPFPVIRTTFLFSFIERLSSLNICRFYSWIGIILAVLLSFVYISVLLYGEYPLLPGLFNNTTPIQDYLILPGINKHIPLFLGWFGLMVAIVVHELGHAVITRNQGVNVISMGLIIPMGASVEVDEKELTEQTKIKQMKILSAGIGANVLVAAVALFLFFGPVLAVIAPVNPTLEVWNVISDSQADLYGFEPGMVITHVNGKAVSGTVLSNFEGLFL